MNRRRLRFVARAYVLACGGIENARLLLASNRSAPAGVGNRHDLVGRFFMDHPYLTTGYFLPSAARYDRGLHVVEDFASAGLEQRAHAGFALSEEVLRRERLNGCAGYFIRRDNYRTQTAYFARGGAALVHMAEVARRERLPDRDLGCSLRDLALGWRDAATTLGGYLAEQIRPQPRLALRTVVEATPCRDSRVTLTERTDPLGMPQVRVDWQLAADDRRGLDRFRSALASGLERRGLGRLVEDPSAGETGWPVSMIGGKHHMGTTRMHSDPKCGVVDPDLKVHGLANLYVTGSSVFPTGGWANPTLTIVALTLRLADDLKVRLRALPSPGPGAEDPAWQQEP